MIAGLILAAGESSRMGRDKALLPYRGQTFVETIVGTLREAGIARIVVVLGHHAVEIQQAVNLEGVEVVVNRDYRRGQTSSLQMGLRVILETSAEPAVAALSSSPPGVKVRDGEDAAATTGHLEAFILCLVDHPAVSAATLRALADAFKQSLSPVVIPTHNARRGHPVVIARALLPELLNLGPDEGANTVIRKYRDATRFVELDDPGVLLDVDDPDTYTQL